MPIFFALIALIVPRGLIFFVWLLTDWFTGVFDSVIWPVLGFLIAPVTLLWYSVVVNVYGGEWDTLQIVVLVISVLIDFSPSARKRKRVDS
jgi:hypothetical protein